MENAQNNNEILDQEVIDTQLVSKTELYGSKKDRILKSLKKRKKRSKNLTYKASRTIKELDKNKFKKIINIFRNSNGEQKISAAKMIIRSGKKQAA